MILDITAVSKKDGGGYYAYFEDGEIILRPTATKDLLEIVWLSVDNKEKRKSGLGEKVLKEVSLSLNGVKLKPWSIKEEAMPFWKKMEQRGLCVLP